MFAILKLIVIISIVLLLGLKRFSQKKSFQEFSSTETLPLRGILCILIILGHVAHNVAEHGAISWDTVGRWYNWAVPVVSTFFFLSGYGVQKGYEIKGKDYLNGFWRKRLVKLLPALTITTAIATGSRVYFLGYHLDETIHLSSGILPLGPSWYVYILILFYLFFWFTAYISEKYIHLSHSKSTAIISFLTIAYMYITYSACWGTHYYVSAPGFVLGYWYSGIEKYVKSYISNNPTLSVISIMFILLALIPLRFIPQLGIFGGVGIYWFVPLALVHICYLGGFPKWKWLCFLGGISYELYLVHEISMIAFDKIAYTGWLFVALVYITSIIAAWGLTYICSLTITIFNKK